MIGIAQMPKGELMADVGDICDYCLDEDRDCIICPLGNPCLGCEDYDQINHVCKSNGGCAPLSPERRTDERVAQ